MFICTYNDNIAKELESKLKLVQKVRNYNKTLYVFEFNKNIYNNYSDKEIFISNKLFF